MSCVPFGLRLQSYTYFIIYKAKNDKKVINVADFFIFMIMTAYFIEKRTGFQQSGSRTTRRSELDDRIAEFRAALTTHTHERRTMSPIVPWLYLLSARRCHLRETITPKFRRSPQRTPKAFCSIWLQNYVHVVSNRGTN